MPSGSSVHEFSPSGSFKFKEQDVGGPLEPGYTQGVRLAELEPWRQISGHVFEGFSGLG